MNENFSSGLLLPSLKRRIVSSVNYREIQSFHSLNPTFTAEFKYLNHICRRGTALLCPYLPRGLFT
jgi:hypothetical protein